MLPDHEAIQWEEWLVKVDQALEDRELLDLVQEALAQRYPRSKNRGRPGTPAEVALRLLLLKHLKNWSYAELEREVRANLVYRQFTRVGMERLGFYVCVADLEDELIRALGPASVEAVLGTQGDLGSFRTFQKQPTWRNQSVERQLRRFMGSADRRKIRYARLLVDALDLGRVPRPLDGVLAHV